MECDELRIDLEKALLHPGEKVKGKCVISLSKEIVIESIRVWIHGTAKVKILKPSANNYIHVYRQLIDYVKDELDYTSSDIFGFLEDGVYVIPFVFQLPDELPTSLSAKHGTISYRIGSEIKYKLPPNSSDSVEGYLSITNPTDFKNSDSQMPVRRRMSEQVTSVFRNCGTVSVNGRTDKAIYMPGDVINILAIVDNSTHREIDVLLEFYQCTTYEAQGHSKTKEYMISSNQRCHYAHETEVNNFTLSLDIKIPDNDHVSPSAKHCDLIQINHRLDISFKVNAGIIPTVLKLEFPITIGESDKITCINVLN